MGKAAAIILSCVLVAGLACAENAGTRFEWEERPPLPQAMAGQFAGLSGDALVVAGGTYWPQSPFDGGVKQWLRGTYVLSSPEGPWQEAASLSQARAYGGSASHEGKLYCMGGSDGAQHYSESFSLHWEDNTLTQTPLPPLPAPCAYTAATVLGNTLYLAGGQVAPDSTEALYNFWALDLSKEDAVWQALDPWPGPARILPVVVAQQGYVYVMSGAAINKGADGKAQRSYLSDVWRYKPGEGWQSVAALPNAVVAAPAAPFGLNHIFVFTGDNGALVDRIQELGNDHPGFPKTILAYHTITDTWCEVGEIPASLVTTVAVPWKDRIVIPAGEDRPGNRSTLVLSGAPVRPEAALGLLDYSLMLAYFALLAYMGFYFSKREKSADDYFLGGKRIPWWAAGLSIYGTLLSAITFLAVPAMAFSSNWVYFVGNILFLIVAPVIIYVYLPFFCGLQLTTAYEYLELRFHTVIRLFGSASFVLFQLGRIGIVVLLPALALTATTGIDVRFAILAMGILCTLYTVLGGIEAVIWSDVIQVIVLFGGALLCYFLILSSIEGGMGTIISTGMAEDKFRLMNWGWSFTGQALWVVILGRGLELLIPYTTDQTVIQRYLSTANTKQSQNAVWLAGLFTIPSGILFFGLGTALYVFYKHHPQMLDPTLQNDAILPLFIIQKIPMGLAGLVIAAVFSAAMSSLDSSLNSISAVLVTDYQRFRGELSGEKAVRVARLLTLFIGLAGTASALLLATVEIESLWTHYMKIIGLFGGALAGLFALGIFTQRANATGALVGALTSAIVLFCVQRYTPVSLLLYSTVGIVSCFVVGYSVSLLTAAPENDLSHLTWATRRRD